jgi:hypothetical protein
MIFESWLIIGKMAVNFAFNVYGLQIMKIHVHKLANVKLSNLSRYDFSVKPYGKPTAVVQNA